MYKDCCGDFCPSCKLVRCKCLCPHNYKYKKEICDMLAPFYNIKSTNLVWKPPKENEEDKSEIIINSIKNRTGWPYLPNEKNIFTKSIDFIKKLCNINPT